MAQQDPNEKLAAIIIEGKQKLDDALANASDLGMKEALTLDYVELIQIACASSPIKLIADNSRLHVFYEQYRPRVDEKGVNIPDPESTITLAKLRKLETIAMYYEDLADQFLARWSKGFATVISKAYQMLIERSVVIPQ